MIAVLIPMLLAALNAFPQDSGVPADARERIATVNAEWLPALQARDAATIAAPYAETGIFVLPTGAVASGRNAVEQLMRDRFAQMGDATVAGELVQDGITRQGTLIYEWGHAHLTLTRPGNAPVQSDGRYLTVWQKNASGRWEIIRNLSMTD